VADRQDVVRAKAGTFGVNTGRYGATLKPGGFELATGGKTEDGAEARLDFTLEEIRIGAKKFAPRAGAAGAVDAGARRVSFDHGAYVEVA
jgi:hypothetical protein